MRKFESIIICCNTFSGKLTGHTHKIQITVYSTNIPILIIHSTNDQVSIKDNVEIICSSINSTQIKKLEVNKAHHSLFDFNEDIDQIYNEVNIFIEKNL